MNTDFGSSRSSHDENFTAKIPLPASISIISLNFASSIFVYEKIQFWDVHSTVGLGLVTFTANTVVNIVMATINNLKAEKIPSKPRNSSNFPSKSHFIFDFFPSLLFIRRTATTKHKLRTELTSMLEHLNRPTKHKSVRRQRPCGKHKREELCVSRPRKREKKYFEARNSTCTDGCTHHWRPSRKDVI